jgi:hypothetical protein
MVSVLKQLPRNRLLADFALWSCDLANLAAEIITPGFKSADLSGTMRWLRSLPLLAD